VLGPPNATELARPGDPRNRVRDIIRLQNGPTCTERGHYLFGATTGHQRAIWNRRNCFISCEHVRNLFGYASMAWKRS
jgi:hypothetical protein